MAKEGRDSWLDLIPNPNLKLLTAGRIAKPFLDFSEGSSPHPEIKARQYSPVLFTIIMVGIGALLSGGLIYLSQDSAGAPPLQSGGASPVGSVAGVSDVLLPPEASDSASASSTSKVQYKLEILNGSGITGKAATLKKQLTSAQFSTITTGNADQSTDQTDLQLKSTVPTAVKQSILDSLKSTYPNMTTSVLAKSSDFDLVLTLGKISK